MTRPTCTYCEQPITLEPWSPEVAVYVCPCCSSRWLAATMEQVHWGSHNDYATYLCSAWGMSA